MEVITTPVLVMSGVIAVFIVGVLLVGVAALAAMIAVALGVGLVRIVQFTGRRISGFGPTTHHQISSSESFAANPLTASKGSFRIVEAKD